MTVKICIANPKGGTGKTSCAVNLSSALALQNKRVLLCDLDPQCSATVALGLTPGDDDHSLAGVLSLEMILEIALCIIGIAL